MHRLIALFTALILLASLAFGGGPAFSIYEELQRAIKQHSITSVDELIQYLPESMRKNVILMFQSRSTQQATELLPRMIFFDDGAKNVVAIAGDASLKGGNSVEIQEFDPTTGKYIPKRILFTPNPANGKPVAAFNDRPAECMGCHFDKLNWDPYPFWPGAMGGAHVREMRDVNNPTFQKFKAFYKVNGQSGRYQAIKGLAVDDPSYLPIINTVFSEQVGNNNAIRIKNEIEAALKVHPEYREALLAAFLGDLRFTDYMPETNKEKLKAEYRAVEIDTKNIVLENYRQNLIRFSKLNEPISASTQRLASFDLQYADRVAKVRYIVESKLGLSMQHWPNTFKPGTYQFSEGLNGQINTAGGLLLRDLLREHPEYADDFSFSDVSVTQNGVKVPSEKYFAKKDLHPVRALYLDRVGTPEGAARVRAIEKADHLSPAEITRDLNDPDIRVRLAIIRRANGSEQILSQGLANSSRFVQLDSLAALDKAESLSADMQIKLISYMKAHPEEEAAAHQPFYKQFLRGIEPKVERALVELFKDHNPILKKAAVSLLAMGNCRLPESQQVILTALRDKDLRSTAGIFSDRISDSSVYFQQEMAKFALSEDPSLKRIGVKFIKTQNISLGKKSPVKSACLRAAILKIVSEQK